MCCSSLPPLFCVFFFLVMCYCAFSAWGREGGLWVREYLDSSWRAFLSVHLLLLLLALFCCSHSALCCICSHHRSAAYFLQFSNMTAWTAAGASCSVGQRVRSSACTCSCSCVPCSATFAPAIALSSVIMIDIPNQVILLMVCNRKAYVLHH